MARPLISENIKGRLLPPAYPPQYDPGLRRPERRALLKEIGREQVEIVRQNIIPPRFRPEDEPEIDQTQPVLGMVEPDLPVKGIFRVLKRLFKGKKIPGTVKEEVQKAVQEFSEGLVPTPSRRKALENKVQTLLKDIEPGVPAPPVPGSRQGVAKKTRAVGKLPQGRQGIIRDFGPEEITGGKVFKEQESLALTKSERFLRQPPRSGGTVEDIITSEQAAQMRDLQKLRKSLEKRREEKGVTIDLSKSELTPIHEGMTMPGALRARGGIWDEDFWSPQQMRDLNKVFPRLFRKEGGKKLDDLAASDFFDDFMGRRIETEELFRAIQGSLDEHISKVPEHRRTRLKHFSNKQDFDEFARAEQRELEELGIVKSEKEFIEEYGEEYWSNPEYIREYESELAGAGETGLKDEVVREVSEETGANFKEVADFFDEIAAGNVPKETPLPKKTLPGREPPQEAQGLALKIMDIFENKPDMLIDDLEKMIEGHSKETVDLAADLLMDRGMDESVPSAIRMKAIANARYLKRKALQDDVPF